MSQTAPETTVQWGAELIRTLVAAIAVATIIFALNPLIHQSWQALALIMAASIIVAGTLVRSLCFAIAPRARRMAALLGLLGQLFALWLTTKSLVVLTPNILLPEHWNLESLSAFFTVVSDDISTGRTPINLLGNTLALAIFSLGAMTLIVHFFYVALRFTVVAAIPVVGIVLAGGLFYPVDPDAGILLAIAGTVALMFVVDTLTQRISRRSRLRAGSQRFIADVRIAGPVGIILAGLCAGALAMGIGVVSSNLDQVRNPGNPFDVTQYGQVADGSLLDDDVDIKGQLRDGSDKTIFQVGISGTDSPDRYIRLKVLDTYSNYSWRPSPKPAPGQSFLGTFLTNAPAPYTGTAGTYTFTGVPMSAGYLPVPAGLREFSSSQDLGPLQFQASQDTVRAEGGPALRNAEYTVQANAMQVNPDNFNNQPSAKDRAVSIPSALQTTTDTITAGATSRGEAALDIQNYLRTFTYDINYETPAGSDPVTGFLAARRGYCEQFSAVMALMAQYKGIDSRVVVGYLLQSDGVGGFKATANAAHAWPELNLGTDEDPQWVRYEPTPGEGAAYAVPQWQQSAPSSEPSAPAPSPTPTPSASPSASPSRAPSAQQPSAPAPAAVSPDKNANATPGKTAVGSSHLSHLTDWFTSQPLWVKALTGVLALGLLLLGLTLLGLMLPYWWGRWQRAKQRRNHLLSINSSDAGTMPGRATLEAAFAELDACATDRGIGWLPGTGPLDSYSEMRSAAQQQGVAFSQLLEARWQGMALALSQARYGNPEVLGSTAHVAPTTDGSSVAADEAFRRLGNPGFTESAASEFPEPATLVNLTRLVDDFALASKSLRPRARAWQRLAALFGNRS